MALTHPFPQFRLPEALRDRPIDVIAPGNAMLEMIVKASERPGGGGQQDLPIPLPIYAEEIWQIWPFYHRKNVPPA